MKDEPRKFLGESLEAFAKKAASMKLPASGIWLLTPDIWKG